MNVTSAARSSVLAFVVRDMLWLSTMIGAVCRPGLGGCPPLIAVIDVARSRDRRFGRDRALGGAA